MSRLGSMIREAREDEGWTQTALAERIGRDVSFVSRLERGAMRELPTPEVLVELAQALPLTMAEMLDAAGYTINVPGPPQGPRERHLTQLISQARLNDDRYNILVTLLRSWADG